MCCFHEEQGAEGRFTHSIISLFQTNSLQIIHLITDIHFGSGPIDPFRLRHELVTQLSHLTGFSSSRINHVVFPISRATYQFLSFPTRGERYPSWTLDPTDKTHNPSIAVDLPTEPYYTHNRQNAHRKASWNHNIASQDNYITFHHHLERLLQSIYETFHLQIRVISINPLFLHISLHITFPRGNHMLQSLRFHRRTTLVLQTRQQLRFIRGEKLLAENGTIQHFFAPRENEICVEEHGGNDHRSGVGIEDFPRESHEFGEKIDWEEDGGKIVRLGHMSISSVRKWVVEMERMARFRSLFT